jgi:25S rRNA (uracil2634-N3)-methyltransferase
LDGLASSKSGSCAAGIKRKRDEHEDGNENDSSETAATGTAANSSNGKREEEDQGNRAQFPKVLFSVDARKLGASGGGGKVVKKGILRGSGSTTTTSSAPGRGTAAAEKERKEGPGGGPWDVICFNFPHVGGLSTDVNRQVRANQELLVSFFNASVPLLSAPLPSAEDLLSDDDDGTEGEDGSAQSDFENEESESAARRKSDKSRLKDRREPGQIVVTLFEGEPYTLWNIRDLARHAGLRVVTSFKFPWASYPGYAHARTLGEIESKHGGRGGWKGEDREARTYVFERKDHELLGPKRSRKGRGLDNDDDDK